MIDFLIIGVQRGGTQSFYDYLLQHPSVVPAIQPDLHFFDQHYERGIAWYINQFPLLSGYYGSKRPEGCITGEASPFYFHHPLVAERIRVHFPNTKIIVLLRNPTDRAYSHFRQAVRLGKEQFSFSMALKVEAKRMEKGMQRLRDHPELYAERNLFNSYISHGLYAQQIKRWKSVFPEQQLLFLRSEEYFADPIDTVLRAYRFLGLPPFRPRLMETPPVHEFEFLTEQTREKIDRVFKHSNEETCRLLKWPHGWANQLDGHLK